MTLARELADTAGRPQVDKNLLINGGMNVWQRSTSQASITTAGYYTADRWRTGGSGLGAFTQSRSTDIPSAQGFGYSLKMDCTTADASPAASDNLNIQHRIEGQNLQHLLKGTSSSKAVTLSFWVKSNKTGTYIIEIADVDNTRHICKSYTIDTASTWEKKELVFDGDTSGTLDNDNASSLEILWYLGVGSDRSSGTLATSWATRTDANKAVGQVNLADSTSNEWYITGVQLEVGEAATDFQFEPFDKVYDKCLRYYEKSYSYDTYPGSAVFPGAIQYETGVATTGAIVFQLVYYKIKRDTPTYTYYDTAGNINKISTAAGNNRNGNPINGMEKGIQMRENDTASIAWFRYHYTADAEL